MKSQTEILKDRAKRFPDRPAMSYFGWRCTYLELDRLSDSIALQLSRYLDDGDVVAVSLQNIPQFLIVQHAAWKLGCAVLPLNPSYTSRELTYMLNDSRAKLVICQPEGKDALIDAIKSSDVKLLTTNPNTFAKIPEKLFERWGFREGKEELDFDFSTEFSVIPSPPESTALLVYTSGTTGEPKGAVITHRNVFASSKIYQRWFRFTEEDAVLGFAPFFHVTGLIFHLATALLSGSCVVMGGRFDPALVVDTVEKENTTVTMLAATAYIAILSTGRVSDLRSSRMRLWSSGGMPVPRKLEEQWKKLTGQWIYVAWGLTETTSPATLWPYPYDDDLPCDIMGIVSSGLPVYDTKIRILDEKMRELGEGEAGEVAVKGPQVISHYLNKPEATSKTIRDGWLLTGDIGIVRKGWIYIIDRKKDMINASGFKVWPREVEEVLYQHPSVAEAAVIGVPDPYRGESVKAFIKLFDTYHPSEELKQDIIRHCRAQLAPYKVPKELVFINEIPKTLSGKILKRLLKADDI